MGNGYIKFENSTNHVPGIDCLCDTDVEFKKLTLGEYLLAYHRKVFLFMYCVKKERIPLYLNNPILKSFVIWRIKINK